MQPRACAGPGELPWLLWAKDRAPGPPFWQAHRQNTPLKCPRAGTSTSLVKSMVPGAPAMLWHHNLFTPQAQPCCFVHGRYLAGWPATHLPRAQSCCLAHSRSRTGCRTAQHSHAAPPLQVTCRLPHSPLTTSTVMMPFTLQVPRRPLLCGLHLPGQLSPPACSSRQHGMTWGQRGSWLLSMGRWPLRQQQGPQLTPTRQLQPRPGRAAALAWALCLASATAMTQPVSWALLHKGPCWAWPPQLPWAALSCRSRSPPAHLAGSCVVAT